MGFKSPCPHQLRRKPMMSFGPASDAKSTDGLFLRLHLEPTSLGFEVIFLSLKVESYIATGTKKETSFVYQDKRGFFYCIRNNMETYIPESPRPK